MRIILSPAKKMKETENDPSYCRLPGLLKNTEEILGFLKGLTFAEAKKLWSCNDKIAEENFRRIREMDLKKKLTPALLSYEGIAYQYMAPSVFENGDFEYVEEHLRILSAFYGVLRPMDGVTPYRLEMQAKASIAGAKDLYAYWGSALYETVRDESGIFINLASKEYSRCIEKYLTDQDRYITCIFGEESGNKVVQKGVYAKMARGEMVRFMAEHRIEDPENMKAFDHLGYRFSEKHSNETAYVFLRDTDRV